MTNIRGPLLRVLAATRAVVPSLGLHQVRVRVRTRTWSSGKVPTGTPTDTFVQLGSPHPATGQMLPPHVHVTSKDSGDPGITVGPLTPYHPVHAPRGFSLAQLNPPPAPGVEVHYMVTMADGVEREYILAPHGLDATHPLHFTVSLRSLDRKVPH